jgi:hypothetical protein
MLHLRHMLALSSTFQAKATDYDTALGRVFYEGVPGGKLATAEGETTPSNTIPFASIWPFNTGFRTIAVGNQNWLRAHGQLHIYLMTPKNTAQADWNNRRLEAIDFLENWTADLAALSAAADDSEDGPIITGESHLAISSIEVPAHDHTPPEIKASTTDFYWRHMVVSFGEGGA